MSASKSMSGSEGAGCQVPGAKYQVSDGRDKVVLPVVFLEEVAPRLLAVNEEGLYRLLGLDDGRSPLAMRTAARRFCQRHSIEPEPGRIFSVVKVSKALNAGGDSPRRRGGAEKSHR